MLETVKIIAGVFNSVFDMIILMIYLKSILVDRREKISSITYYGVFIILCAIQYGVGWISGFWFVNMAVSIVCVFMLTLLYDNYMSMRIFVSVSFQVFAMLSELICYTLLQFLHSRNLVISDFDGRLYANTFSKLIMLIIIIIITGMVRKNRTSLFLKDRLFMLVTPFVSVLLIIAIAFQFQDEGDSVNSHVSVCLSAVGIMIINFIVYHILENLMAVAQLREKQMKMETQFDYQEKKYLQTSQSFKSISGIIHDTNKHLLYLRECIMQGNDEDAIAYINKAINAVDNSYKRYNTGNIVIDALVSNAANMAIANNITFKTDIDIDKDRINIERYDLSVVLGNLLDNAIEACMGVLNPDDRYLKITLTTSETALIIFIVNSSLRKVEVISGSTSKQDKIRHGYGIKNINMTVDKYGGTFYYEQKESSFEASVILPLRDE